MSGGVLSGPTLSTRPVRTVCVVGSGGREHALALALARTADVVVTPGNPGICGSSAEGHTITSVAIPPEQLEADLYVIGPEAPLVDGLADRLRADGRLVFGPGADGARLEGSKAFMKELLAEAGVPTARFGVFADVGPAVEFLRTLEGPWVVKTDGLAAGKGVLVTDSLEEAESDVAAKLSGDAFGSAGRQVVIEEGLTGTECSLLVLCDGERLAALAPAQDFKRRDDGDLGQQRTQVPQKPGEDDLGLGVAEAHVELEDLRAGRGQHQAGVEDAPVVDATVPQSGHQRSDGLVDQGGHQRVVHGRHR